MGSFRKRLLVLIIGLVLVTQTVTLAAVLASTAHNVEARAAEQLRSGSSFAEQLIRFRAGQLANGVGVLAADFGFREAVASGDAATILSAATNNALRIGADMVLLMDVHGIVMAATGPKAPVRGTSLDSLLEDAQGPRDEPLFLVLGGRPYQFFLAPVRTPETIAWVAMGFLVDDQLAQKLRALVGAEVTVVAHGRDGAAHAASTLAGAPRAAVAQRRDDALEHEDAPRVERVVGTEYLSYSQRMRGRGDSLDVILQKPMHAVLAPYRDVRDALLLIDGIAVVLAAAIGTFLGRSASRPIGELVRAAQRIQAGRYDTSVQPSGGEEFQSLAAAFNSMQRNIAEREADITHQAYHDPLTGLPNRALAERRIEELIAETLTSAPMALILVDVRNVREISASLGHHVADDVLREVARRLSKNISPDEIVFRLGESQFLVAARDCSTERAPLYADQLAGVIRTGFHLIQMSLDLDVAAGVCMYPHHGRTADELLRRAQIAIEDADEARTRVAIYSPGQDEQHRRRLALITDLRTALDQDALTLVYQPKVTMATRSVRSLEALVRWTHPQLGPVGPGEFVPLAERTGASRRLTSWVLRAAIRQMGEWRRENLEVEVAVNLSAPDILDPDLGDEILETLRAYRVEPTALLLEITESAVMRDPQLAARNMQLLRIAGVRFAIDDFGTGHSSLSQLSRLPVDELKIDRSFITNVRAGSDEETIVTSTIELGHSMGLNVVAEGVEEPEAWNLLRRLGCDFAQGYLISRPLAVETVAAFVREANQLLPASDSTVLQIRALETLAGQNRR
ncbi:MAG TPA: EAL domain-containing protein [Steroidobacteraceae bacterium]|nr:EAL domain-containing protein [Steroidobacteraceae bacterium]